MSQMSANIMSLVCTTYTYKGRTFFQVVSTHKDLNIFCNFLKEEKLYRTAQFLTLVFLAVLIECKYLDFLDLLILGMGQISDRRLKPFCHLSWDGSAQT